MSNNWLNNIKHVTPGEPVQAGVVSRPDRVLADRVDYLRDRLDAADLGRAVFDVDAAISPDVLEGQPVYWNATTQRYEQALAAVENDEATQALLMQASSECVGLCFKKKNATMGDIVLQGIVRFPPPTGGTTSPLSNAITGPIVPGKYYLSSAESGKLVKQRPPVTVSVCHILGPKDACTSDTPWVIVAPQTRDFLEDHIHYRFELVARPAGGTDPDAAAEPGGRHTIINPDVTAEGWLPADHEIFRRNPADPTTNFAPRGAAFGYNLSQHPALSNVWPPQPLQAVAVLWDKGIDRVGATEVPLGIDDGLCVVDANGIWWMSDCYGDAPWPATLALDSASESLSMSVQGTEPECERYERMRIILVFLRMVYGNDKSVVTSLQPGPTSPIKVTSCDTGNPATTGDLQLDLNLNFLIDPIEIFGGQVFKEVVNNSRFRRGWVTEGVRVGSTGSPIKIASTQPRGLTGAEKTALGLPSSDVSVLHRGIVTVNYDDQLVERELSPQIIRLSDVVERLYKDIPYLGFPKDQDSLVRVRLNIPGSNLGNVLRMKIRAQLFGRGGTTSSAALLPPLYMTYRRLSRPVYWNAQTQRYEPLEDGINLPGVETETNLTFNAAKSVTIDTAIEVESSAFVVAEGDTILVTLGRNGNTDSYDAEVGLLRLSGIVYVPETVV